MVTRRQILVGVGVLSTGSAGVAYSLMNSPVEETGSSESGIICHAPAQDPPDGTLSILGVQVDKRTISVDYNIKSDYSVESVAIVIRDEIVTRQSWDGESGELNFEHDGPVTFEIQARSKDGQVLDSAKLLAECVPARELQE